MAWNNKSDEDDMAELFASDVNTAVPSVTATEFDTPYQQPAAAAPAAPAPAPAEYSAPYVPPRQRQAAQAAAATSGGGPVTEDLRYHEHTLDESVLSTLARDGLGIWRNLKLVCNPFATPDDLHLMLRNWDFWGPLIFTLALAAMLSLKSDSAAAVFNVVFIVITAGALLLTTNVILLGGSISFFQSICLLGYCVFPMDIAALVCYLVDSWWGRLLAIVVGMAWSMRASVPFVGGSVGDSRRFLAVYPIFLMYSVLAWLTYVS